MAERIKNKRLAALAKSSAPAPKPKAVPKKEVVKEAPEPEESSEEAPKPGKWDKLKAIAKEE